MRELIKLKLIFWTQKALLRVKKEGVKKDKLFIMYEMPQPRQLLTSGTALLYIPRR
jgi:hypothetical protein